MKALNNRIRRVGENIRSVLSKHVMLREHQVEKLNNVIITITEVQPTADLRHAKVFITSLGGNEKDILNSLNSYSYLFSKLVAKEIKTKYSPKLSFHQDYSFEQAKKIEELINLNK